MTPHEIQQLIGTSVAAVIALGTILPLGNALVRRIAAPKQPAAPALTSDDAERMARMERAIDAIATEVERVAEGQRYMTKVLTPLAPDQTARKLPPAHNST